MARVQCVYELLLRDKFSPAVRHGTVAGIPDQPRVLGQRASPDMRLRLLPLTLPPRHLLLADGHIDAVRDSIDCDLIPILTS